MVAFPLWCVAFAGTVSVVVHISNAETLLSNRIYGNESLSDGNMVSVLDQGRIRSIDWGWDSSTKGSRLAIKAWSSDRQSTVAPPQIFGDYPVTLCNPVLLEDNDYIIGYTVHYTTDFLYGVVFETLRGHNFSCYKNEAEIAGKAQVTVPSGTYYNHSEDFFFLSGWNIASSGIIDGIQFEFTHIATVQPQIYFLPGAAFTFTTRYPDGRCYDARYQSYAWCPWWSSETGDPYVEIDLGRTKKLYSVGTKGQRLEGSHSYVSSYRIAYRRNGGDWRFYNDGEVLTGNNITNSNASTRLIEALNVFSSPIIARHVRWYPNDGSGRIEMYGHDYFSDDAVVQALVEPLRDVAFSASTEASDAIAADADFSSGNAWAASTYNESKAEHLQIDLERAVNIYAVATKGRDQQSPSQYVSSYTLSYSLSAVNWTVYPQELVGNNAADKDDGHRNELQEPIAAQFVRFHPQSFVGWMAMRVEVFGYEVDVITTQHPDDQVSYQWPSVNPTVFPSSFPRPESLEQEVKEDNVNHGTASPTLSETDSTSGFINTDFSMTIFYLGVACIGVGGCCLLAAFVICWKNRRSAKDDNEVEIVHPDFNDAGMRDARAENDNEYQLDAAKVVSVPKRKGVARCVSPCNVDGFFGVTVLELQNHADDDEEDEELYEQDLPTAGLVTTGRMNSVTSVSSEGAGIGTVTCGDKYGVTSMVAKCADCGANKGGAIYPENGQFYCVDCWTAYAE